MLIIVSVIDNISTVSDIICCSHVPDPPPATVVERPDHLSGPKQ